jgi:hypothetical protein
MSTSIVPRLRKDRTCSARNRGTTPDNSIVNPPDKNRRREAIAPAMPAIAASIPTSVRTRNDPPLAPPKISATTLTMKIRGDIRSPRTPPISPNAKCALTNHLHYEGYVAGKVLAYWREGFSLVSALLVSLRDGSYINGPRERV